MFTHLKAFMFGGGGVKLVLWTVERDCFSNNYKKLEAVVKNGSRSNFG